MDKVTVSASSLRKVLVALSGPDHYIRELQATRGFPENPIDKLITEFNAAVELVEADSRNKG